MTCIIALKNEYTKRTIIGGDSAASSWHDYSLVATPKVFRKGPALIGYTHSFRMGFLLEHKLELPDLRDNLDYWANVDLVDACRALFKEGGFLSKKEEKEEGGKFLICVKDLIYVLDSDFQALRTTANYDAVGSGEDYAKGSLWTSHQQENMDQQKQVRLALEAAEAHNNTVKAPFHYLEINHED